jgi:GDP-4-dehydro-6-deoxy-D-mannose reductase
VITTLVDTPVLVTGAGGFIGRHLSTRLEEGGAQVWRAVSPRHQESARVLAGDLEDPGFCERTIRASEPAVVFHAAGTTGGRDDASGLLRHIRGNVITTGSLMSGVRAVGTAPRVVVVSSAAVYGAARSPIAETAPLEPTSGYGVSKVAQELIARRHHLAHGADVVAVRPFNLVGPGQPVHLLIPELCLRIARAELSGATSIPVGSLQPHRDFVDVADAVEAMMALSISAPSGSIYNIGSGVPLTVADVVERLLGLASRSITAEPDESIGASVYDSYPAIQQLEAAIVWKPRVSLDASLAASLEEARHTVKGGSQ